jgi:hypothetical protein
MPRFMLPLIALTILAACGDAPTKESPVPNVAAKPAASTAQTPSAKKPAATATLHARSVKPSTVCTRYRAQLAAAQRSTAANPSSATAKAKVKSLQTLVTDACE